MAKPDISTFYRTAIDVIYGVIIGVSFTQIDTLFIPIGKLSELHGIIDGCSALFAYFVIITGWIGYHKSISDKPHRGRIGNLRFAVDLIITFLAYYLVVIVVPKTDDSGRQLVSYSDTFVWILPFMFFLFVIWDVLKNIEYWDESETRRTRIYRTLYSVVLCVYFIVLSLVYSTYVNPDSDSLDKWNNKNEYDFYFLILSAAGVVTYRLFLKWNIVHRIHTRRQIRPKDGTLDSFI